MMRTIIIIAIAALLAACGENTETTVTVEDQSGNTTKITIKEEGEMPRETTNTMVGHPLAKYSAPEDARIMLYFPMMVGYCGKNHSDERCDSGVKEFQRRAEIIGRNIEEKYIRNPAFWEFQLSVAESEKTKSKEMYKLVLGEKFKALAAFDNEQNKRLEAFKKGTY